MGGVLRKGSWLHHMMQVWGFSHMITAAFDEVEVNNGIHAVTMEGGGVI